MPGNTVDETKRWLNCIDTSIVEKQIVASSKRQKRDDEDAFRVVSRTIIQKRMGYTPAMKNAINTMDSAYIRSVWFLKKAGGRISSVVCLIFISSSCDAPKFGTKDARDLVQGKTFDSYNRYKRTAMVVLPDAKRMTPSAKKIIHSSFEKRVIVFKIYDLLFDPTEHFLFPRSRRLSRDEVTGLCKKMGIEDTAISRENRLPHLKASDPMCKFMGYEPMDVVQIDRGTHVYWRVVLHYV